MKTVPITDTRRWFPAAAELFSLPGERTPELYAAVVRQFRVESNPRYLPVDGATYCNAYAEDVMRAMGVTLPHWVNPDDSPAHPGATGAREQTANDHYAWLNLRGRQYGWTEVEEKAAQDRADDGFPTIAAWRSPPTQRHGHIAVVIPGGWEVGGPWVAHAGRVNSEKILRLNAFGIRRPRYWTAE